MIGLDKLTKKQIETLRQMCLFTCQNCGREENLVGTLETHRLTRRSDGGKYCPNNILIICNKCHNEFHSNEFSWVKGK